MITVAVVIGRGTTSKDVSLVLLRRKGVHAAE
jgi:hypothetical protein